VLTTLHCVLYQMQFSVGSCSPGNSGGSSEFVFPFLDYEDYVQYLVGDDPYAPGFAPDSPAPTYAPAPFCVYMSFVAMIVLKWLVRSVDAQSLDLTGCKKPLFMLVASITTPLLTNLAG